MQFGVVRIFPHAAQNKTDAGAGEQEYSACREQGIIGWTADFRSRYESHVRRQSAQAGEQGVRNMRRVSGQHERNKGISYGATEAEDARREQPAP